MGKASAPDPGRVERMQEVGAIESPFEVEDDEKAEAAPPVMPQVVPAEPAEVAEARAAARAELPKGDYVDALVNALLARSGPITDGWLSQIRQAVESAGDYDELLGRLAEMFDSLPLDELGRVIEQASTAAERAGRYDVQGEAGGA